MRWRSVVGLALAAGVATSQAAVAQGSQDSRPGVAVMPFDNGGSYGQNKEDFDALSVGMQQMLTTEFAANPALAETHVADATQLLPNGGSLVILNYSYRGDLDADRHAVTDLSQRYGFTVQRNGTRDFTLWDGATFLLRRMG